MLESVKVLIAGDDAQSCWLLRLVLEQDSRIAVVGHARDGRELSTLMTELGPDVVLLELDSPGQGTTAAVKIARLQGRQARLVGLATSDDLDEDMVGEVDALFDKRDPLDRLPTILRDVANRENTPSRQPSTSAASTAFRFNQLLSLYIANLERGHRELEERVNLVQFWLQGPDAGGLIHIEQASAEVITRVTRDKYGLPSYTLSVDGFFNAHHKVIVAGLEGSLHPHSWRVNVKLRQQTLGEDHLLLGFADVKRFLRGELSWFDGKTLNDLPQFSDTPPTTENIAALLFKNLKTAVKETSATVDSVTVWETPVNSVTYSED